MKRLVIPIAIIIFSCTFLSCQKEEGLDHPDFKRDTTLAGSVSSIFHATHMDVEGTFNETTLGYLEKNNSFFDINKVSDTVISFRCAYEFDGESDEVTFISIPKIPLTGKPFDAAFNHASSDVIVHHRNIEYSSVLTSVKGWIKELSIIENRARNNISTKTSPAIWIYDYQIDITCVLDGKILNIKTTKDEQKFPSDN